ncbi:MAG: ShlB/FhaC/HecB family hemolysin secretion/activation protein, partial [Rhodoferax sp.]|nr:ShlB/FhaC/HecB family hemolysin secretion/activation protein [Rhodoferax sp.]
PLEHRLLLLSDLPGVKVNSSLVPGAAPGSSDLIVNLTPGKRISGSIDADNAGNHYTGANRIGATINFNEPLGLGDVASLRALTSGKGLNYLRGAYQMQFGKAKAGVAYGALRYELGEEFASLGAHGTTQVASLFGSYPLIRSRNENLYAGLVLDAKKFRDEVDATGSVADKKAQVLTTSVSGNSIDALGGGGQTSHALAWSTGNIDLQTPSEQALDAVTAQSNGHFNKLAFGLARLQHVTDTVSLYGAINGQYAWNNLDVSEKMELGGMYGVRAYPEGETYADQGYVINLEARWQLPKLSTSLPGQVQLIGFIDTGRATINKNPWSAEPNKRTLSGAGVGVNWYETNNFMVRAYYAVKVGDEAATSAPDKSGRFWIQAVKYF